MTFVARFNSNLFSFWVFPPSYSPSAHIEAFRITNSGGAHVGHGCSSVVAYKVWGWLRRALFLIISRVQILRQLAPHLELSETPSCHCAVEHHPQRHCARRHARGPVDRVVDLADEPGNEARQNVTAEDDTSSCYHTGGDDGPPRDFAFAPACPHMSVISSAAGFICAKTIKIKLKGYEGKPYCFTGRLNAIARW